MTMLDDSTKSLNAAIASHSKIKFTIRELARGWSETTLGLCPDFPDCDHDDSEEHEKHGLAIAHYELAQELLQEIGGGWKDCVECDKPIPDPQLLYGESEYCLLHKDPG